MARGRNRGDDPGINMTPMIDVVFQLIIFFVITADMQDERLDQILTMAMAPNSAAQQVKDPREINIDVDKQGRIMINRKRLSQASLKGVLTKSVNQFGQTTPVTIRGDGQTKHDAIRQAMDACSQAGLYRIKFGAVKERAEKVQ
jgi:biopolymer transport protein ExbD